MKKFALISLTLLISVALVAPLMAADLSVSGQARFRGTYRENTSLNANTEESLARYDFRVRPVLTYNINDNIKLTTRVVVFNESFGTAGLGDQVAATGTTARNLNDVTASRGDVASWDRGFATIKFSWGVLDVGRMTGGTFGLDIFDIAGAADRVKFTLPFGDFTLIALTQKIVEGDFGTAGQTDGDSDLYAVAGVYKQENWTAGLLYGFLRNTTVAASTTERSHLNPYFTGQWGNFGVKGEAWFQTGDIENDAVGTANVDISGESFYIAGTGAFGPINAELGYVFVSGDSSTNDNDAEVGRTWGAEYTPLVVMTDIDGYLNGNALIVGAQGLNVVYGQVGYSLTDTMTLTGLLAYATVDEQRGFANDEFGTEFDLKFKWQVMDNLTYQVLFGYLFTDDWIKGTGVVNVDDTFTLRHILQIDF